MRNRAPVQSPLVRVFREHVSGVYSWMDRRAKSLNLILPFSRAEFHRWILTDIFANSQTAAVQCTYCSQWLHGGNFVLDHADPVCYGGSLGFENMVVSCADCNRLKGKMSPQAFRAFLGFLLTIHAQDVNDIVGRMKNGAAYVRVMAEQGRRKRVANARLMTV